MKSNGEFGPVPRNVCLEYKKQRGFWGEIFKKNAVKETKKQSITWELNQYLTTKRQAKVKQQACNQYNETTERWSYLIPWNRGERQRIKGERQRNWRRAAEILTNWMKENDKGVWGSSIRDSTEGFVVPYLRLISGRSAISGGGFVKFGGKIK
jgi:hypothetical protein